MEFAQAKVHAHLRLRAAWMRHALVPNNQETMV
jgi:hypothetical protein